MPRRLGAILLWSVVAACLAIVLSFAYGRDQGIYAVVARTMLEGGAPYRDAWDFKPPGIFVMFALARALFGPAQMSIRIVEGLAFLAMAWAMITLAERWWADRMAGLLAAALAALVHAQLDFWHTAQPETFAGILTILALVPGTSRRASPWPLFVAGFLFGCAGLFKPPLAGGGVVLAVWAARRTSPWRAFFPVAVGGLTAVLVCVAWFAANGAAGALYEAVFRFAPHYTALSWHGRSAWGMSMEAFGDWLFGYSGPALAGVLCLIVCRGPARERDRWRVTPLLGGLVAVSLAGVALQGKFFPYHYAACWPPTALLGALGWRRAFGMARTRGSVALLGLLAFASLFRTATRDVEGTFWHRVAWRADLLLGNETQRDRLGSVADIDAAINRRVAAELQRHVAREDSVYVWGFEPILYDMSEREAPTRYIHNVPQRASWSRSEARRELMHDLSEHPPQAIVVVSGDSMPMVLGHGDDSRVELEEFAELRRLIADHYGKLMLIGDFELYLRRD